MTSQNHSTCLCRSYKINTNLVFVWQFRKYTYCRHTYDRGSKEWLSKFWSAVFPPGGRIAQWDAAKCGSPGCERADHRTQLKYYVYEILLFNFYSWLKLRFLARAFITSMQSLSLGCGVSPRVVNVTSMVWAAPSFTNNLAVTPKKQHMFIIFWKENNKSLPFLARILVIIRRG